MKKSKNVDMSEWVTQKAFADELGVLTQRVTHWIRRGNIKWQYLPGSRIKLVNKNSLSVKIFKKHKETKKMKKYNN